MTIRVRLLLSFILLVLPAFYYFTDFALNNVRPRYLETVEESMNDTANILASVAELDLRAGRPQPSRLRAIFQKAEARRFEARIYDFTKSRMDLRAYMTDDRGIVLFDSMGQWEGLDFSRWNDVHLTLRGRYGARSTRTDPHEKESGAYYVAAAVRGPDGGVRGVVSVGKSKETLAPFIAEARRKLLEAGVTSAAGAMLLLVLVTLWITRPLARLHAYVNEARLNRHAALPRLGRTEIGTLGMAFEEMRIELEGKRYVETYVETFTHELKSPLSALLAAAELLEDDLNAEDRGRFVKTVRREALRLSELVEHMLTLSALENQRAPIEASELDAGLLVREIAEQAAASARGRGISCSAGAEPALTFIGEEFLVRQALANLMQNALDFTPAGGTVRLSAARAPQAVVFTVEDSGVGIPDFARERIFDRFYSLPRPNGRRSTGLGLPFVREVAAVHGGSITAATRAGGGAIFTLRVPRNGPIASTSPEDPTGVGNRPAANRD